MSIYRWHDPTRPPQIGRTWTWIRELDKVSVSAPKIGRNSKLPDYHMEWTWPEWCEIATCAGTMFEEGRAYRYENDRRYVAFGWERRARRDYQTVMHIRGHWDGVEIVGLDMPEAHWADVVGCMNIAPPRAGTLDRVALLMGDEVTLPTEPGAISFDDIRKAAIVIRDIGRRTTLLTDEELAALDSLLWQTGD